jgi:hypothetical protein
MIKLEEIQIHRKYFYLCYFQIMDSEYLEYHLSGVHLEDVELFRSCMLDYLNALSNREGNFKS